MKLGSLGLPETQRVQERLFDYFKAGRVHPSLLLTGPDRALKLRAAKNMAKLLFCEKKKNGTYCEECSSCQRIEKEIHPDVYFLTEENEDTIKIETVREIIHQMEVSPIEERYKICIVDECHRMNQASANAFLKTLEEPGPNRFFFLLTTQPGSLLLTIHSRCIQFSFKPEDTLNIESEKEFEELLLQALKTKNLAPLVSALDEKERTLQFLRFLQFQLHHAATGEATIKPFSTLPTWDLCRKFDAVLELEGRLRSNANYGLMLESLVRQNFL